MARNGRDLAAARNIDNSEAVLSLEKSEVERMKRGISMYTYITLGILFSQWIFFLSSSAIVTAAIIHQQSRKKVIYD